MALVLGLLVVDAQVRGWNEDATIIGAFADSFNGTARSLRFFLATKDFDWANESIRWLASAADIAQDQYLRGGFPSGAALGLTLSNLHCAITAQVYVVEDLLQDPSRLERASPQADYIGRVEALYGNVSADLDVVQPRGIDPLSQLPPDRVQSVRAAISEIRTLGEPWYGVVGCPDF